MKIMPLIISAGKRTAGAAIGAGVAIGADKLAPASVPVWIKNAVLLTVGTVVPEFFNKGGKETIVHSAGAALAGIAIHDQATRSIPMLASVNGIVSGTVMAGLPETISVDEAYKTSVSGAGGNDVLGDIEN